MKLFELCTFGMEKVSTLRVFPHCRNAPSAKRIRESEKYDVQPLLLPKYMVKQVATPLPAFSHLGTSWSHA